jgi:uncharacterized membrane protein YhhN
MNYHKQLLIWGGACGIVGTLCYIGAAALQLNTQATFLLAMAWPILSIIFLFSLFRFFDDSEKQMTNYLAFIFGCLAFTLVAAMLSSQLSVVAGTDEYINSAPVNDQELLKTVRKSERLVDLGIDVAWDLFIGTSIIFLGITLRSRPNFGFWWALPAGVLGLALIVLNVITFPWPPNTQNLFDIGPVIGVYIIFLAARVFFLGIKMKHSVTQTVQV